MSSAMDPSLLQDFLTESGELIEQLDTDLVKLEAAANAGDPGTAELCNSVFRALHTVKGAASFLGLESVIRFAHVAEDALNRLRKGEVRVTSKVMDTLLKAVDVLRGQINDLNRGQEASECPPEVITALKAIVEGAAATPETAPNPATPAAASPAPAADQPSAATPLKLPPQKADLVEFMVADLKDGSKQIEQCLAQAKISGTRPNAAEHLTEIAQAMSRTADFFELDCLTRLIRGLEKAAPRLAEIPEALLDETLLRLSAIRQLVDEQAAALSQALALSWPIDTLLQRLASLVEGQALDAGVTGQHQGDVRALLVLDGVIAGEKTEAADPAKPQAKTPAAAAPAAKAASNTTVAEQTIRVEVARLESLLNLVGQLVLTKNRLTGVTRRLREQTLPHELKEDLAGAAGELDRLTGNLQVGVMRTRMQPLAKLFERYPRVIRDMARMTHKKINLEIVGKETEVDKSVLELLSDPLVHILRNSADHGCEPPEARLKSGKSDTGTIRLSAEHQGSHVRVEVADDGKGIDRQAVGRKAVEKGIVTAEDLAKMSDPDVLALIFAPGLSTAEKVSDLSGRGVGMDVVRTNVTKMNGQINVSSVPGKGTTIEILIPLTVAIMPAMVVGVGKHLYSIPLQSIIEIVRPEDTAVHSVSGQPVMRLRDSVLPLLDMRARLNETVSASRNRFAVVVGVGHQRVGLVVDRLIGQQEVVIKPLDDEYTSGGPFSGATIREDGDVSLILDVVQLVRSANTVGAAPEKAAA